MLALGTAGLVLLAVLNFLQERHSQPPDDGVWWREAADGQGLMADRVLPDSPGLRAGIRAGDKLTGVNILDRKSTRLNSSHCLVSRMPSSA